MRNPITALRQRADRRADNSPAGCCECGTGGPHYRGSRQPVTRYVYVDATGPSDKQTADWTACSRHLLPDHTPAVDYGRDVVKTYTEVNADLEKALADLDPCHCSATPWPMIAVPTGADLGELRRVIAGLPDKIRLYVEDESRTSAPGVCATYPVTAVAVIPAGWDDDEVLLGIKTGD